MDLNVSNRALFILTSHNQLGDTAKQTGWHLAEASHIYFPLVQAGFRVDFASPKGGKAEIDNHSFNLDDHLNKRFMSNKEIVHQIENTIPVDKVNPEDYQVLHFPGGHGTMWDLPDNKIIQKLILDIYNNKGIVSAICHGPAALVNIIEESGEYFVKGKSLCSFTDEEEKEVKKETIVPFLLESKLKEHGAHFIGGKNWADQVVVYQRLVTGQNPQSTETLARKILELYNELYFSQ